MTIKYYRVHDYSFGLPTVKTASMFRTSLSLLIITLLEISSWAFLFAWRLESIILEDKPCKGPPLYQVINPGLAFIPRVSYHLNNTNNNNNPFYVSFMFYYLLSNRLLYSNLQDIATIFWCFIQ